MQQMTKFYKLYKPSLDGIMRVNQLFNECPTKDKINLVIGAYRTRSGAPFVFESVKLAKKIVSTNNHEYLPITGDNEFVDLSKKLYFRTETNFKGVQTLSGTGSLYLVAQLLKKIVDDQKTIFLPNPTWDNHFNIFHTSELGVSTYDYLTSDRSWNWEYVYDNVKKLPDSNIVLFHGCAHNPSGYDPHESEWRDLIKLCVSKNMLIIIDMAYLGFASGDIYQDSAALRAVNDIEHPVFVCTSYAKNFGLYSERVGNLFFKGYESKDTSDMNDILRTIIRQIYSSPPSNGSSIIKTILSDRELEALWLSELVHISQHYDSIRTELKKRLETKLNYSFSDIVKQRGMFYYSDLTSEQVKILRNNSIFLPDNGRISLAGINDKNIEKFVVEFCRAKNTH
jgi:aspartate aminotransferase